MKATLVLLACGGTMLAILAAAVLYTVRVEDALYTDTVDEEKS